MRIKFDQFLFDSSVQAVYGPDNEALIIRPQALHVLQCLLTRSPDLVSKKELLHAVWGHEAISESAIAQAIREIRKVLGDDASAPRIVGTRHGCGYQIVCSVRICEPDKVSEQESGHETVQEHSGSGFGSGLQPSPVAAAVVLPVLLLAGLLSLFSWPDYMFDSGGGAPETEMRLQSGSIGDGLNPQLESSEILELWRHAQTLRRQTDLSSAIETLARASKQAPNSSFIRVELLQLMIEAGYPIRAAELLHDPVLNTENLELHEQLLIQAATARMAGKYATAADIMQALVVYFPDHQEFLYMLFYDRLRSSSTTRARQVLKQIEDRVESATHDARFWLASFELNWRTSRLADAMADTELALETARLRQSQALEARALSAKAKVKAFKGEYHASAALLSRAREHFNVLQDQQGLLDTWRLQAMNFVALGELHDATRAIEHVCRIQEQVLDGGNLTECLFLRGILLASRDDLEGSVRLLDEAAVSAEHNVNPHMSGQVHLVLGQIALRQARINAAMDHFRQSESYFDRSGCLRGLAYSRLGFSSALAQAGSPKLAKPDIIDALEIFRAIEDESGASDALEQLLIVDNPENNDVVSSAWNHASHGYRLLD